MKLLNLDDLKGQYALLWLNGKWERVGDGADSVLRRLSVKSSCLQSLTFRAINRSIAWIDHLNARKAIDFWSP